MTSKIKAPCFEKLSDPYEIATPSERLSCYWNEFIKEYPNEEDCVSELFSRAYGRSLSCTACGAQNIKKSGCGRLLYCHNCKQKTYALAGTFFHNIRKPRAWLGAIWFMEHGIPINSAQFARLSNIYYSAAQEIFKRLTFQITCKMNNLPEVCSREFINLFRRRSRITPAGEHPDAEQLEIEKLTLQEKEAEDAHAAHSIDENSSPVMEHNSAAAVALLDEMERVVYETLSGEMHFDKLVRNTGLQIGKLTATLTMLELKGFVKGNGNWFSPSTPVMAPPPARKTGTERTSALLNSFTSFIFSTFAGISRKYIQMYLGWFWCLVDRHLWQPGSMSKEFFRLNHKNREYLTYVSPLMVRVPA